MAYACSMSLAAHLRRSLPVILLGLLLLAGAGWLLQGRLAGWIEGRLVSAVEAREGLRGSIEEVDVCLPCASYTLLSPRFSRRTEPGDDEAGEAEEEPEWRPLLEAEAVVVSLLPGSLLRARPLGAVRLRAPVLHVRSGGVSDEGDEEDEGLGVPWAEVGRALLPFPIDRLDVEQGRLLLSNPHLDPPLRWEVERVTLSGTHLTRGSAPARIEAQGRIADAGRVEGSVRLPPDEEGFTLEASLREIPATELNAYLRHLAALDLEAGTLDADASLRSDGSRSVQGRVVAKLSDLDVVDLREVAEGRPLRMLWESLTGVAIAVSTSPERPLELEIEIQESLDEARMDAWSLLALVVRRSLVSLVESPATVLRWLGERVVSAHS